MSFTFDELISPGYFQRILPFLTFTDEDASIPSPAALSPPSGWQDVITQRGVVRSLPREVWGVDGLPLDLLDRLSLGLTTLDELGLPLSFLAASREAQALANTLGGWIRSGFKDEAYANLGDYAFFHVDSGRDGSRGWPPHRDRNTTANALVGPQGTPAYITCWVPLTSATPYTSCLYFLPRQHDTAYECVETGDATDTAGSSLPPTQVAFPTPESFQHILALPCAKGGLVAFTSRTLHWGSAPLPPLTPEEVRPPRQAFSCAFALPTFEKPALARGPQALSHPTFLESIAVVAAQGILYHTQAALSPGAAKAFWAVVNAHGGLLEEGYRGRVMRAGGWIVFSSSFAADRQGVTAPPSASEIALVFAARAGAEGGFDAALYA